MEHKYWVCQEFATVHDGTMCFCPLEATDDGEVSAILTGINLVSSLPNFIKSHSDVIGIVQVDNIEQFSNPREIYNRRTGLGMDA